jgi:CubicO group peptidase (beta-lactamase class C family)
MERYVDERKFPGSSVLIERYGQEVFHDAVGLRDLETRKPFTRDTVVRLYSMTKPVTSCALMMLVEKGLCHLNIPVSEFVSEFKDMHALIPGATSIDQTTSCATPTLHHLLTHTSGLTYGFNAGLVPELMVKEELDFKPGQTTLARICNRLSKIPLVFEPGKKWEYSVSIDVLGRVIELISGQTLDSFFQAEVFKPLGMTQTGFTLTDHARGKVASLYTPLSGNPMALNAMEKGNNPLKLVDQEDGSPFWKTTVHSGGGGLVGTLDDYMKFVNILRNGGRSLLARLLSPKTLSFMMRNHLTDDIASMGPQSFAEQPMEGMGFGLGGAVVLDPALPRIPGHIGDFSWGGMASTFFWVDHVADMSVVFLTQVTPSSSYPARSELKALVHGAMIK